MIPFLATLGMLTLFAGGITVGFMAIVAGAMAFFEASDYLGSDFRAGGLIGSILIALVVVFLSILFV